MFVERRKAPRYRINARVVIRNERGDPVPAVVVDISSSGMLVHLDWPNPFQIGEAVTLEVALPHGVDAPLSPWAIGSVVRLDGERSAIHLHAGSFQAGERKNDVLPPDTLHLD